MSEKPIATVSKKTFSVILCWKLAPKEAMKPIESRLDLYLFWGITKFFALREDMAHCL